MARYNNGIVYTNENCIGCNKCISSCPAPGANVVSIKDGINRVEVSKKCVDCGICVKECSHNARDFRDDAMQFLNDLRRGDDISLLVDPSVYLAYGDDIEHVLGYLKEMGVKNIYDVSFGAELSVWAQAKYIKDSIAAKGYCKEFILNTCPAIVNYAESRMPELVDKIIPVHSPAVCTAIYARRYLADNARYAYISACVAEQQQIKSLKSGYSIQYHVTMRHLMRELEGADISEYSAIAALKTMGEGNTMGIMNGYADAIARYFPKEDAFFCYNGFTDAAMDLFEVSARMDEYRHPRGVVVTACRSGCVFGTGTDKTFYDAESVLMNYQNARKQSCDLIPNGVADEIYAAACERYKDIKFDDFVREFEDRYIQPYVVPESTIQGIFKSMHKDTDEKQNINCRSCGYKNCREMANAIANGYGKMQNCVHYMNDDLREKSMLDMQTGIYNSMGFFNSVSKLVHYNPYNKYVVAFGNVNRLRVVNDLYGREVGNKVICYIARCLAEFVGDDGICARMGGGNYTVCFPYTRENVDRFTSVEQFDCSQFGLGSPITMRFGMSIIEGNVKDSEDFASKAAYALEKSEDRTVNTYTFFTDEMQAELEQEARVTNQMRKALDKGEFVIYLQPQYDHRTGEIVGAETLSRWLRPSGTLLSPGIFIPVFEKNGFIREMDKYIWEKSFALVKDWEDRNMCFAPISVNISRISLMDESIVSIIASLQRKYNIDKDHLHFEITESAYMEDQKLMSERIAMIRNLGYSIAMDDFGSGYSSLNSLKDIPLDILKLDMGFLRGEMNIGRGKEIIAHMIDMAHDLNLITIAEGVETLEQADMLTEMGCDIIQGFYYARPMPVEQYEIMIKEQNNKI